MRRISKFGLGGNGFVYFAQCGVGGPVKIGFTNNIERRISTLQSGCPIPLRVIGVIVRAGEIDESILHDHFEDCRMHGEWFWPSPGLLDFVRDHTFRYSGLDRYGHGYIINAEQQASLSRQIVEMLYAARDRQLQANLDYNAAVMAAASQLAARYG
jgi:hypothetical protein